MRSSARVVPSGFPFSARYKHQFAAGATAHRPFGSERRAAASVQVSAFMDNVVSLADYRKQRQPAKRAIPASETDPHYVCLRCETGEFRLYSSGMVHCAQCGSLMRNLLVRAVASSEDSKG